MPLYFNQKETKLNAEAWVGWMSLGHDWATQHCNAVCITLKFQYCSFPMTLTFDLAQKLYICLYCMRNLNFRDRPNFIKISKSCFELEDFNANWMTIHLLTGPIELAWAVFFPLKFAPICYIWLWSWPWPLSLNI